MTRSTPAPRGRGKRNDIADSPSAEAELNFALLPDGKIESKLRFRLPGEHSRDLLDTFEGLVMTTVCLAAPMVTAVVAAVYHLSAITLIILLIVEVILMFFVVRPIGRRARRKR